MRLTPFAIAASILLLAGCSSTPQAPAPPKQSTPTASTAAESDMEACAIVADTLQPAVDTVTAIVDDPTGQTIDPAELSNLADQMRDMLDVSSAKMDAYAAPFASAILTLDDIFEGRADTHQNLDTGAFRDASIDILAYCVDDVGYKAP